MTLQYCSDLHLEFPLNKSFLKENPIEPEGEILLIAGDLMPFNVIDKHKDFFKFCADHFQQTYWIPGNHEYYGSDISLRNGSFHEKIRPNVHLLNNRVIHHGKVRLILSTLWTKINPTNQWQIENGMNDFRVIKNGKNRLTTDQVNVFFEENLRFIKAALTENEATTNVVVTHHVPTLQHYPPEYKGSAINEAFAVDLTNFIEDHKPNYWIYGHHHRNIAEFYIGATKMLTNQLGYVMMGEHFEFRNNKIINLTNHYPNNS